MGPNQYFGLSVGEWLVVVAVVLVVFSGGVYLMRPAATPKPEQPGAIIPAPVEDPVVYHPAPRDPLPPSSSPAPTQPVPSSAVTFMFDDGGASVYTEAKPIMDRYGFKGSVSVVTNWMGGAGFMPASEIQALAESGWDVVSHSVTHTDMTMQARAEWQRELSESKAILEKLGLFVDAFVPPYGAYSADIVDYGRTIYKSIRAFESGDNPYGVSPYDVKVRQIVETTTAVDVARWVNEGKARGRWQVLVFHVIGNTSDDEYHTPPSVFSEMLSVVAQSGVPVVTYREGLSIFADDR